MVSDGMPFWKTASAMMPKTLIQAKEDAQVRQMNERLRLLYVALTRAEKWLIVTAAGDLGNAGDSWYDLVEDALTTLGAEETAFDGGPGLRLSHGDWGAMTPAEDRATDEAGDPLPGLFRQPAPPLPAPEKTLQPSDLGGAKALPGEQGLDEEAAKLRGTRVHLLLEHLPELPQDRWDEASIHLLWGVDPAEQADVAAEAFAVLEAPDIQDVFAPHALAEVPVTARIGSRRLHGTIDRLIVSGDRVLAIDFKTNAVVPASPELCPEGLLRQMGAYAAALTQIYPDRRVDTAILWTRTRELMLFPHELVTKALDASPLLDDHPPRS